MSLLVVILVASCDWFLDSSYTITYDDNDAESATAPGVETPIGTFLAAMKGSFAELDEDFRPFAETNNHELKVAFHPVIL